MSYDLNSHGRPSIMRQCLAYLTGNADRHVRIEELTEETGLRPMQISNAVRRLRLSNPGHLRMVNRGVYVWSSAPVSERESEPEPEPAKPPVDLLVEIVSRKEDMILVRDSDTGTLYVMTPFTW